jgi:RHS repeat-associated protein
VITQYAYNGDGDRVSQTVGGVATSYVFDPVGLTQVLAETTAGQSKFYVPGLAQYSATGWEYFGQDRLGSVRTLLNPAGKLLLARNYDPFGNVLVQGGVGSSGFGYTGEPVDSTGLVYLRARYYSPVVGRFLTPDSVIPDPLSSQAWNQYSYVENNPIKFVDPSGHSFRPICFYCDLDLIDVSDWPDFVKKATAFFASVTLGAQLDAERGVIVGPTVEDYYNDALINMFPGALAVTRTACGGMSLQKVKRLLKGSPGNLPASIAIRRIQAIQALGEAIAPFLPRIRKITGEDALIGFRGSLARGRVGNLNKPTRGQPINLDNFDIDFFIISDSLASQGVWGDQIPELRPIQREIRSALKNVPELQGLKPGREGFSIRIFSQEDAARHFGNEEIYFIGGR